MNYPPLTVPKDIVLEVTGKSDSQISVETAYKWAQRAVVAYSQFAKTGEIEWLIRAEDYRHEALEHASLVEDAGQLVGHLLKAIDQVRAQAKIPHSCCVCR